ncbi:MAG: glycosyltransferase family 39 protein [Chloroflexota bacterium]|nr:glycosyltransferase family 39 protein [Chloroflexota bacterium]
MTETTSRRRSQFDRWILWLILLLATALRFLRIGNQSLWADEGNSVALALRSISEISANAAADIHPPLYYWFLHFWVRIFGTSEIAVRSLSAVWGIFLVWLVYQIGSRLHDRRTGLIAAFLAAINPFLIYYSQEARMYSMLAALAALLFYGLVRFILHESIVLPADGTGKTISFSAPATAVILVASIAGLYTHYTFPILILTATLLYLLWVYDSRRRGFVSIRLLQWGLLLIVMGFFYLPWLGTAIDRLTSWPRSGQDIAWTEALSEMTRLLALGPVAQGDTNSVWMVIFILLFILGLFPWARPGRRRSHWLSWLLPFAWLATPVFLILLADLYKPAFFKFLIVSVAPFVLLMGRGITGFEASLKRNPWGRRSTTAAAISDKRAGKSGNQQAEVAAKSSAGKWISLIWVVVTLILVIIPTAMTLQVYYFDQDVSRDDYRAIASYIEAVSQPDDAVILNAPGQQEVFDYYYGGDIPVYGLPEQRPVDKAAAVAQLEQLAGQHRQLFALFWATDESDPDSIVEGWLDTHAYKSAETWQGNVRFVIYATQQATDDWPEQSSGASLGDQIRLNSYALSSQNITSGEVLQLQLAWQALSQADADYTVFVQLLDARNQVAVQRDAPPISGGAPTGRWQTGEVVIDNHGLFISPGTAPGDYLLITGMYNPQTGERLISGAADYIDLGTVRVERPDTPPAPAALGMDTDRSFKFDEVTMLGFDHYKRGFRHAPDTPLHPNDLLHFTFFWQADVQPTAAWWFTVRLIQGTDKEVAAVSGPLVSKEYPTLNWEEGEIVRGEHDLFLPDYLTSDRYQLQLFLHTGNPEAIADRVNLGQITISEP